MAIMTGFTRNDENGHAVNGNSTTGYMQLVESLCHVLDEAQKIIREQAALLDQHGIVTEAGKLEALRTNLLAGIDQYIQEG